MPITTLETNDVLQWNGTEWRATSVLVGVETSTIIAGGTNGQALTSNGTSPAKFQGMTTQGDIEYFNGTDRARLAPGTSGQFLKTQGASANPIWATISGIRALLIDWTLYSVNGGEAETTATSYTLPGGTLGANEGVRLTMRCDGNNGIFRLKVGGTALIQVTLGATSNIVYFDMYNDGAVGSQYWQSYGMTLTSTPAFIAAGGINNTTINTAADLVFAVTLAPNVAAMALHGWTIEHIRL
mgnify:CR=1 FL=1